ncbi:cell wall metabolism sensor histidine kinase WalK [Mycobacterium sp. 1423905.2]|uniref:sensor histidine kinase n=1 Tax=Mycobacterium sp. 1423905.2 TaxID=1856859 RepID=UPI000800CD70|nr:ATP-binding protein [Mycobacterium sp. 1423905.2]OBJ52770.1 two-component sensor histidine kinase [Mycobacterium sp. 1423905.2]
MKASTLRAIRRAPIVGRLDPRRASVRTRSALAAALVMTACFAIGCGVLALVLYRSLESSAQHAAAARAEQISAELRTDTARNLNPSLLATDSQIGAVQIVDGTGKVVASSAGAPKTPLTHVSLDAGNARNVGRAKGPHDTYDLWMSAQKVSLPGGAVTVLVGADQEHVEHLVRKVTALLAVGAPAIIALGVVGTYRLVGAALGPVEAIRARVALISSTDLAERVPVPPTRDVIAHLAITMNAMLARLERGRQAQRRLVGDASHELRSPLATITTALEMAAGRPELMDNELINEALLPEARRMQHLIDELLLLARSDEDALNLRQDDVDLDDLLAAEASRLKNVLSLHIVSHIQACRAVGDRAALARVIRNLVDNAARHATSTVQLDCHYDAGHAVIIVADDGPGIPATERTRIFERFVRLDDARARSSGGSGLGLSIVAEVVRAHHGTVTVGDAAHGGAAFTVTLPTGSR